MDYNEENAWKEEVEKRKKLFEEGKADVISLKDFKKKYNNRLINKKLLKD